MNTLIDSDDDFDHEDHGDRELTLSTGAILGIFFGLVLLCGAFFGFGYKMGSHKPAPILAAEPATTSTDFSSFQPTGSSSASAPKPTAGSSSTPSAVMAPRTPSAEAAVDEPAPSTVPRHTPAVTTPIPISPATRVTPEASTRTPTPVSIQTGPVAPVGGGFVVQVAAISPAHQGDAELLVSALKAKGYPAAAHSEPQDKLLHIQVGPYPSKQAADAVKQRLSSDGYNNPIVK